MIRQAGIAVVAVLIGIGSLQAQDQPMSRVEVSLDLLKSGAASSRQHSNLYALGEGVATQQSPHESSQGPSPLSLTPLGYSSVDADLLVSDEDAFDPLSDPLADRKSPALAAIYSLLLPGMGELYAGGFSSGKYFLMVEGALWLTYGAFTVHGGAQQDDARSYAIGRAGIDPSGKDDQFYVDIGNFLTTEEYNDKRLRDREPELLYSRAEGEGWTWESDAARAAYKEERLSSERTYNNRKFVVAAIVVNHIASAINAARAAVSHNTALDRALGDLRFDATVLGGVHQPHGVLVTVRRGI